MFALSIRQPWACAITHGLKVVEVRSFEGFFWRGPLLIHAGKSPWWRTKRATLRLLAQQHHDLWIDPDTNAKTLERGGIVGIAHVADVIHYNDVGEFAADADRHLARLYRDGDHWFWPATEQRFTDRGWRPVLGLVLENAAVVPFSPLKGRQNLFQVSMDDLDYRTRAGICNWTTRHQEVAP